jgi:cyclic-di-AMP phosphodiesterase PgpH
LRIETMKPVNGAMKVQAERRRRRLWSLRQILFWVWLTGVASVALMYAAPGEFDLAVGDVAPQDIRAPREVTFISDILSEQARQDAARRVVAIYTSPDPLVARQQYARARAVLEYVRALRADRMASLTRQYEWLRAVPELTDLPDSVVSAILSLPDSSWSRVQIEFLDLLDQLMRQEEIRDSDLRLIRSRIPARVPLELAQDEAEIVEGLVSRFVQPNVFYDSEATEAAIVAAREAVDPAVRQYRSGEVIIREGTALSRLDVEALEELGLASATEDEYNAAAVMLFSGLSTLVVGTFIYRLQPTALDGGKQELLITTVLTVFLGLAWLLVRSGELVPYLYPGAAAGMLIATTVGPVPGVASMLLVSAASGWIGAQSLKITAILLLGGLFAIFTLPRFEQTGPLFRSGLLGGIVQALVVFVFSMDEIAISPLGLLIKMAMCVLGGLISGALTVGGLFVLTPIFDLTTTFRLTELSRPNHPLLQRLLREAPATFNHVMMVTSLAEQAAERIHANALLTRVGAYYHDIGKLARPYFFVENQQGLSNPHDRLDPYTSVDVLAGHVRDGLKLAEQYHLPSQVRAFIPEHHGTMRVSFLYQKAVEAADGEADLVDESQFRYPGPRPQSRETLLVMLADGSEAATRARRPSTPEELEAVIDKIFEQRMQDGQLDDCPITMAELHTVKRTYVNLLRGAFHPRVQYPEAQTVVAKADHEAAVVEMDEAEVLRSLDEGDGVEKLPASDIARITELALHVASGISPETPPQEEER